MRPSTVRLTIFFSRCGFELSLFFSRQRWKLSPRATMPTLYTITLWTSLNFIDDAWHVSFYSILLIQRLSGAQRNQRETYQLESAVCKQCDIHSSKCKKTQSTRFAKMKYEFKTRPLKTPARSRFSIHEISVAFYRRFTHEWTWNFNANRICHRDYVCELIVF